MRVVLVRHGQSEWNASHRLQGQADIALSEQGRKQAVQLRPVIERIGPCRTVSSDLARVRDTAELIGGTNIVLNRQLREMDVGEWTGQSIATIIARDRDSYLGWRAGTITPPKGEGWQTFADRVCRVIEEEAKVPCENLLVVCHGGVIRAILQRYLNLQPANIIPVGPASATAFRLADADRPARLELFNYRPDDLEFEAPD